MREIVECVMNVSEGKNQRVLSLIADAIRSVNGSYLLNCSSDIDHNRTVFSFVGDSSSIVQSALGGCESAFGEIDLSRHRGVHPRIGAVDVIPLVPIQGISLEQCAELARRLGRKIGNDLQVPVYLYEAASSGEAAKKLAEIRRGQFERLLNHSLKGLGRAPDFGPDRLHSSAGAVAVGAREILIAYNIFLASSDVQLAKEIARRIRASSGGLPYLQALGFSIPSRNQVQVSMNLTRYRKTRLVDAFRAVQREARVLNVEIACSELVGLMPEDALNLNEVEELKFECFHEGLVLEECIRTVAGWRVGKGTE